MRTKVAAGDINLLAQDAEICDVLICVSGLHHVVELKRVLRSVRHLMSDEGELWMVGEQIGRNGNFFWRAERQAAELLFARPAQ